MVRHRLVDSLELYIKYEFLKRNTYEDAHQNVREMIRSNEEFRELRDNKDKTQKSRKFSNETPPSTEVDSDKESVEKEDELDSSGKKFKKKYVGEFFEKFLTEEFRTLGLQAQDMLFSAADCLKLLLLRNSSFTYNRGLKYRKFPMKRVIISRANGKVKVQMLHPCQNAEYWRCENGGCIVWHGYHARMDKSRRFQRMASIELERVLCSSLLDEIEFKTEDHNSWNPNIDPFFTFVRYMKMNFNAKCISTKKVSMELGWFGDCSKENNTLIQYLLKNMDDKTLETIKFRKWNGRERETVILLAIEETLLYSDQWRNAKEWDIQDRNIKTHPLNFLRFDTVHIPLGTDKFLIFCDKMLETQFKNERITFIVPDAFDFVEAGKMAEGKYKFHGNYKYEMEAVKEKRYFELKPENAQIIFTYEKGSWSRSRSKSRRPEMYQI
ncbi:hypothetical protein B9Z55_012732 [Caenorhabditis nigoni]|uniref:DUF38 domain-containing protein n=1 Tax=Caenorhabditis nigoni TaxID=1611254 RepID=A0A2G5TYL4_9PELO|nr:hypothetical protein B9Z55_012732 [Caenorhabditis nigoni]